MDNKNIELPTIKETLKKNNVKINKSLGQNFLFDLNLTDKIVRNSEIRLIREGVVIFTGSLSSLKRFKDDAKEVTKGYDCGLQVKDYNDIKVGDEIEGFINVAIKKKI